jgi:micrococcal nuclease
VITAPQPAGSQATGQQTRACANYDAWEWAQAVFESDPKKYDALDPDNDGEACPELPRGGFAPAFWLTEIPEDVEEAEVVRLVDGDTLEVRIDGVSNRVRIYRADTPETRNEKHCGGAEATDFAEFALSFNDDEDGTVYLERDKNEKDRYGRELAYVWFEVDDKPYLLNHILINNGWAEDVDYGDRKYDEELKDAAAFAKRHDLGVWDLCGAFGQPLPEPAPTDVPAAEQPVQQPQVAQPAQAPKADQPARENRMEQPTQEPRAEQTAVPTEPKPEYVEPEPEVPTVPVQAGSCDPAYPDVCIPPVSEAGKNLNCADVLPYVDFTVLPPDPHGFDGNPNNGIGCERD